MRRPGRLSFPYLQPSNSPLISYVRGSMALFGNCELIIKDRKQGKNEGLDDTDEQVEHLPAHTEYDGCREKVDRDRQQERDHDPARKEVPEKPQRQRDRLHELFEGPDRGQPPWRGEERLDVTTEAFRPDGGP